MVSTQVLVQKTFPQVLSLILNLWVCMKDKNNMAASMSELPMLACFQRSEQSFRNQIFTFVQQNMERLVWKKYIYLQAGGEL